MNCAHLEVEVTLNHPHGDIHGCRISDLISTPPENTRQFLTLSHPVCAVCGSKLTRKDLSRRLRKGGDLFDPRIKLWWN